MFSEGATEILDGPIIYVDPKSTLVLTCRVDFGDKTPEYIIWRKENKVSNVSMFYSEAFLLGNEATIDSDISFKP